MRARARTNILGGSPRLLCVLRSEAFSLFMRLYTAACLRRATSSSSNP
jgi:hypothetical protein